MTTARLGWPVRILVGDADKRYDVGTRSPAGGPAFPRFVSHEPELQGRCEGQPWALGSETDRCAAMAMGVDGRV